MGEELIPAIKVGKKEHLEELKKGMVFFARNELFLNDDTDFRGDPNEGKRFIDPTKIKIIIDGKDIFQEERIPYPFSVKEEIEGIEKIHIFCCSVLTENVREGEKNKRLTDEFVKEMSNFGDHFLFFDLRELTKHIYNAVVDTKIGMDARFVRYKDIFHDFSSTEFHTNSFYNRFFIKDEKYKVQSEYRIIINGHEEELISNCEKGYILEIDPLQIGDIYEIDALKTVEFY